MKINDAIEEIKNIIANPNCRYPYFFSTNDPEILYQLSEALIGEVETIDVSDYCKSADAIPDINKLIIEIKERRRPIMVRGLNGYLLMKNRKDVKHIYRQISDLPSSKGAAIILCFGTEEVKRFFDDPRICERIHTIEGNSPYNPRITLINPVLELEHANKGIKLYLEEIEKKPPKPRYYVQTQHYLGIEEGTIYIEGISSFKDYVTKVRPYGEIYLDINNDVVWKDFYQEAKDSKPLHQTFHDHFGNSSIKDILDILTKPYEIWLFISYLKNNQNQAKHPYIDYVISKSNSIEDFNYNLIFSILDYGYNDPQFSIVYKERKLYLKTKFVKKLNEYCGKVMSKLDPVTGIHYLTDTSNVEKESIMSLIIRYGTLDNSIKKSIQISYPDLYEYMQPYIGYDDHLREYFNLYKEYKLLNIKPGESFLSLVNDNIKDPKYIRKESRDKIFKSLYKTGDKIYFIDGLGIEYLSLIESICEEYGLDVQIYICRSNLPTITSTNIEVLKGLEYTSDKMLDNLAHKQDVSEEYNKCNKFIVEQIEHIRKIVTIIQESIKSDETAIIYSDHGMSRAYVLNGQKEELEWDVDSEHNGRCAVINEGSYDAPNVKKESNYYVVADYGRIKNNIPRAKIEAHGGATIEEVLVPLIRITSSNKQFIECEVPEEITLDPISGKAELTIYCSIDAKMLTLLINGKEFESTRDLNNYSFIIEGLASGTYEIRILHNRHRIKDTNLKIIGKGMKKNNNLFNKLR